MKRTKAASAANLIHLGASPLERSDPKPEKRASDKLSLARPVWSCGRARGGHAGGEEGTYGRADLAGLAPGGGRHQSGRHLARTRDQRSHRTPSPPPLASWSRRSTPHG